MIKITSPAFAANQPIPPKYTCDGEDTNPALKIEDVPENTKSLVLIADDPDSPSGTWNHWLVWNIDPQTNEIKTNSKPAGAVEGNNSAGQPGYYGPCPHTGTHRYFFKVFALDTQLNLPAGAERDELEQAIAGHIIDQGELMGRYARK